MPFVLLMAAIAIYTFGLAHLLTWLIGLPFLAKLIVSATVLVPLGFAMGMPFPTGLRALASAADLELPATEFGEAPNSADNSVEWAWAMNAAASVLGSVLAMVIALHFGLNVTLACGGVAYLVAMALLPTLVPRST